MIFKKDKPLYKIVPEAARLSILEKGALHAGYFVIVYNKSIVPNTTELERLSRLMPGGNLILNIFKQGESVTESVMIYTGKKELSLFEILTDLGIAVKDLIDVRPVPLRRRKKFF